MTTFLILQLRPETDASDSEYAAILAASGLSAAQTTRIRLDQDTLPDSFDPGAYAGVIVGGGPGCVSDAPEDKSPIEARIESQMLRLMPAITARDMPFMGCCYGIGILGAHLGAKVSKDRFAEPVQATPCRITPQGAGDPMLDGLPDQFGAFVAHKEALQELPEGCTHLVTSDSCPFQMLRYGQNVYATQFHPEADPPEFEARVRIYQHHGYFPPEDAESLITQIHASDVRWPAQILRNFARRYGAS